MSNSCTHRTPDWHAIPAPDALDRLGSGPGGLSEEEAARRLSAVGPNQLPSPRRRGWYVRLAGQLHNLLVYVLLASAALSAAIGHGTDALVILAVVAANALIGFVQEGRAEDALAAIQGMIDPTATVLRAGRRSTVPAAALVPGDLVLLDAGDRVPADMRLLRARGLRIDESALTGESVPAEKTVEPVPAAAPIGDRACLAHSGCLVAAGQGAGVVFATGVRTELGRVSAMLGAVRRTETPLLRAMDGFARQVTGIVLAAAAAVFAWAVVAGTHPAADVFMAVVGLVVAAIPEGLPAVMTITLALGVRRMARRNAIVRRLPAVETLGAVTVICSDKTGTLTRNEMTVATVVAAEGAIEVTGAGYRPEGHFTRAGVPIDPAEDPLLERLALAGCLASDASLREAAGETVVVGDPMEGALVALAAKAGHDVAAARLAHRRLDEIPFDPGERYMAVLTTAEGPPVAWVKGAPERVLSMCGGLRTAGGEAPLDPAVFARVVERLASGGQRVLALACRSMPEGTGRLAAADVAEGLTLLGLVGLIDPPRPEAAAAVAEARAAGIRLKMITGDHAATARAIAVRLKLADDPVAVTGPDLDALDPEGFRDMARTATVFARTTPEHKLRLVQALQADGAVVAMTGDGVNDAPALKRADVGVAMGRKGTEAAKEASEVVLADDNFATIVAAVREGRTVYDNLTKVIAWTLPTDGGESLAVVVALLTGLAMPVTPVQILWINTVTAVALGLTLAFEPPEPGVMARPPRAPSAPLLGPRLVWRVLYVSVLMVAGIYGVYAFAAWRGLPVEAARTLVVNAVVAMEIAYLFSVRFVHGSSLTWTGLLGTRPVLAGVAGVTLAQVAFTYWPPLQALFGTLPVTPLDGAVALAAGAGLLMAAEAEKRIHRLVAGRPTQPIGS